MPLRDPPAARGGSLLWGLVDTIDGGLLVVDTELTVVHWNTVMERLTGIDRDAACGRGLRQLVPALDAIALPEYLGRALVGDVSFSAELPAGVPIDVRCVPLRGEGGRVIGAAAFISDVTELRRRTLIVRAMEAVGRSLTSSLDLNEALDTIVTKTLEVMAADSALVVSWDAQASQLRVMRAAGRLSDRYASAGAIPVSGGPVSRAVLEGRPVTTSNILADPRVKLGTERRAQIVAIDRLDGRAHPGGEDQRLGPVGVHPGVPGGQLVEDGVVDRAARLRRRDHQRLQPGDGQRQHVGLG